LGEANAKKSWEYTQSANYWNWLLLNFAMKHPCWPSTQVDVGWPSVAFGFWKRCACLVNATFEKRLEVEIDGKTRFDLLSKVTP
jgi:hypothetical protein